VLGQLLYSESKGKAHCEHGDYSMPSSPTRPPLAADSDGAPRQDTAKVLLVRRGLCTFVTKVRIAQEKGAQAVVVVDRETSSNTPEDIQKVVMADDGWGNSVQIPSILVSKTEGQLLIDAAKHETVMVELDWNIPRGQ
ncbi:VSR5, partial [Symbiodinium sp. KB8]